MVNRREGKKRLQRLLHLLLHHSLFDFGDTIGIYYRGIPRSLFWVLFIWGHIHCLGLSTRDMLLFGIWGLLFTSDLSGQKYTDQFE